MQDIESVEAEYHRLMVEQPWIRRNLTVEEFAEQIGASSETVRCMIRDVLIRADRQPGRGQGGRWYIPATRHRVGLVAQTEETPVQSTRSLTPALRHRGQNGREPSTVSEGGVLS